MDLSPAQTAAAWKEAITASLKEADESFCLSRVSLYFGIMQQRTEMWC